MALLMPARDYAPYGCQSSQKGRLHTETATGAAKQAPPYIIRSDFQRDRDRILHSNGFRRMKHKTQVFVYHEGDYFRTRLTHSLEVAQIARTAARSLGVNEDLAEAIALAHDLGHTPFGHAGEEALNEVMIPYGGFDHNEQTLRILTQLEERYADVNGLNLCWETLEGVAKHNGPVAPEKRRASLLALDAAFDMRLDDYASVEAQLANLSDDIAYLSHDFEDGLRAGLLQLEQLETLPVVGPAVADIYQTIPDRNMSRVGYCLTRAVISHFIEDLISTSYGLLDALQPQSPDDVRMANRPMVAFSEEAHAELQILRAFLFSQMWRHYKVNRMTSKSKKLIQALFKRFLEEPNLLPTAWFMLVQEASEQGRARIVADYVASMTDRYALLEYERVFEIGPILI